MTTELQSHRAVTAAGVQPGAMCTIRISRVSPLLIVIAVLAAVMITGCRSSSKPPAATSNNHGLGLRFATCMRHHGVSNFPTQKPATGSRSRSVSPRIPHRRSHPP